MLEEVEEDCGTGRGGIGIGKPDGNIMFGGIMFGGIIFGGIIPGSIIPGSITPGGIDGSLRVAVDDDEVVFAFDAAAVTSVLVGWGGRPCCICISI